MCSRNKWGVSTTVAVHSSLTSSTMSVTVRHIASRQQDGTRDLCAEGNLAAMLVTVATLLHNLTQTSRNIYIYKTVSATVRLCIGILNHKITYASIMTNIHNNNACVTCVNFP